jgi:hypothetical protein
LGGTLYHSCGISFLREGSQLRFRGSKIEALLGRLDMIFISHVDPDLGLLEMIIVEEVS